MRDMLAGLFRRRPPVVTEARPFDVPALAAIHARSFRRGWSEEEFATLMADRRVLTHRVVESGRLFGFIMSRLVIDEAEILSVAVAPRRRGRGLARLMLDVHLRRLAGLGAKTVFLEVDEANAAARKLYARAHFHQVGRRTGYYTGDDGAPPGTALILRRDLA